MRLTAELAGKVESLYRESLEREFGKSFTFDPILVEPAENSEGERTFKVIIVYEGEGGRPNLKNAAAVLSFMVDQMEELGLPPIAHRVLRPQIGVAAPIGAPGRASLVRA